MVCLAMLLVVVFGGIDVFLAREPILKGVASGTYWKGAVAMVLWAISLQLAQKRTGA